MSNENNSLLLALLPCQFYVVGQTKNSPKIIFYRIAKTKTTAWILLVRWNSNGLGVAALFDNKL